jgi:pimeloyl-ACP methyl ester carboxylesterase
VTISQEAESYVDKHVRAIDGLDLYYRDYAARDGRAATPVACLHGLTRNARDFENVAPWIAGTGRRVIVPDVRGRGRSGRDPDPTHYDIPVYVNDLVSVLDDAGAERVVVVGTSMGGLIGAALNLIHPERVAAMILNDVGPKLGAKGMQRIAEAVGGGESYSTWDEAAAHAERALGHVHPDRSGDGEFWNAYARKLFRETDGRIALDYDPAIAEVLRSGAATADLWPLFDGLRDVPTLLLRGSESELLEPETVEAFRARKPNLTVAEVPGVGHAPTLEEDAAVAAVKGFLHTVD